MFFLNIPFIKKAAQKETGTGFSDAIPGCLCRLEKNPERKIMHSHYFSLF